jgi:hypothetical protein
VSDYCTACDDRGGRTDPECPDQWYWCDECDAAERHYLAKLLTCRALAAGLLGVCLGMARDFCTGWTEDDGRDGRLYIEAMERTREDRRESRGASFEFGRWLVHQAAPWEES